MNIEATITRMDAKLTSLLQKTNKQTWVKVSWITDLTGWDGQKMRQAREDGLIIFRKNDKGFEYLLESLPEQFIKKVV